MAGFLYYLPGRTKPPTLEDLRQLGLGHAFQHLPMVATVTRGPAGEGGLVVARECRGQRVGYYEARQRWIQEPGAEWWIGYYLDAAPTPEDLARPEQIDGELVEMGGHQWLIPHAREFIEYGGAPMARCTLPQALGRDDAGSWVPVDIKPQYAELWRLATAFIDAVYAAEDADNTVSFRFDDADRLAMVAIATNYFAGAAEIDALRIYDSDVRAAIVNAVNDVNGFARIADELSKKKAPAGSQPAAAGGTS